MSMSRILCSTGAILTRRNNRDYTQLPLIVPQMKCDGIEFMMYESWYAGHIEELKKVSGIGDSMFERIQEDIVVE